VGSGGIALCILNLGARHERSGSHPYRFKPGEKVPSNHWMWGWMGPRAGLEAVEKRTISCLCQKSNPNLLAAQPVASRHTYSAIPAPKLRILPEKFTKDMVFQRILCGKIHISSFDKMHLRFLTVTGRKWNCSPKCLRYLLLLCLHLFLFFSLLLVHILV
jgi:hypothetical protein